jgi:hypothetical protein
MDRGITPDTLKTELASPHATPYATPYTLDVHRSDDLVAKS